MVLGQRDLYAVALLRGVHAMLCGMLVVVDRVTIFGVTVVISRKGFVVLLEKIVARSCEWP